MNARIQIKGERVIKMDINVGTGLRPAMTSDAIYLHRLILKAWFRITWVAGCIIILYVMMFPPLPWLD